MDAETGSVDGSRFLCTHCECRGIDVEAKKCTHCDKLLCVNSETEHKTYDVTSGQEGWNKDEFQQIRGKTNGEKEMEFCLEHPAEIVKFYCETCETVCCSECVFADHMTCKPKRFSELPEEIKRVELLPELKMAIDQLNKKIAEVTEPLQNQMKSVKEWYSNTVDEIRKLRIGFNEHLDRIEAGIMESLTKVVANTENDIKMKLDKAKLMETEIQIMTTKLESKPSKQDREFVVCKQVQYKILKMQEAIGTLRQIKEGCPLMLKIDEKIKAILREDETFAHITDGTFEKIIVKLDQLRLLDTEMQVTAMRLQSKVDKGTTEKSEQQMLTYLNEISFKAETDSVPSLITGLCMMSTGKLAVADHGNKTMKILNKKHSKIVSNVPLPSAPWDVTETKPGKLAVTLPEAQTIKMFSMKWKSAKAYRSIEVNGKCYGIATAADGVIVSYVEPAKLELLDLTGNVLRQIAATSSAHWVLERPEYVAVSRKDSSIFVSDSKLSTVTKFLLNGSVLSTTSSDCLKGVRGLTVTKDGTVLICNYVNDNIVQMSHECKIQNVVEAVEYPWSLCYCADKNRIYVSCIDKIKIFQLRN